MCVFGISGFLLRPVAKNLVKEYNLPDIRLTEDSFIIVRDATGREIDDIKDEAENEIMGDLITSLIQRLTADKGTRLHCSLAGGRKTMSFYLGAALRATKDNKKAELKLGNNKDIVPEPLRYRGAFQ